MPQWLSDTLAKSAYFMPHGHCYLWIPWLLWLHVLSDFLIGIAYLGISVILWALVRRIRLPFSPVFIAFGLFIALCGVTHFVQIWNVWHSDYITSGFIKAATAAASVATAIGLFFIRPQIEELVYSARLSEERRVRLETTHAELESTLAQVQELNELRTRFFANVSHELRTPLTLILGPVQKLLADASLTPTQREQLVGLEGNSQALLKQVNNLLDLAKVDFGNMQLAYSRFDASSWGRRVAAHFEFAAHQRSITLEVVAPGSLPLEADREKLERVLVNLLSNALKFTPDGGRIIVRLETRGESTVLSVADSGPGVPPDERESVFERFQQARNAQADGHGGTGLGLAIVREFVALHRGAVEITDTLPQGATFTVTFPSEAPRGVAVAAGDTGPERTADTEGALRELESARLRPATGTDSASVAGRPQVLLVEDNDELRRFITDTLSERYNVVGATDGEHALALVHSARPDLIVTDVMMPRMDGDALLAAVRADERLATVPVLVLSAKADDPLRARMLERGAQDYLTKPFNARELLARTGNLIEAKRAGDTLRDELASASTNLSDLARDVRTKRQQLTTALHSAEVARHQAERATQVKSAFLSMMSHELRTPLATIQLNLGLLERAPDDAALGTVRPRVLRMSRANRQMSSLVEGLLEYTRAESGRLAARVEPVELQAIAASVVEDHRQLVPEGVQMVLVPPDPPLPHIETDPRLVSLVLSNLVSNALKFTQSGTVSVELARWHDGQALIVRDTGIGIANADLSRIFDPFEQLEPVRRKTVPGIGLGLALVKQLVDALGGRIAVSSTEGSGTVFRVDLPDRIPS